MMQHNRKIIYLVGFLYSFPFALASYINSSFISSFTGQGLVGLIYVLGSIGSVLALLSAPKILSKIGGYRFLLLASLLGALAFLTLVFASNTWTAVIAFIFLLSLNTMLIFSLDELLKIFSKDKSTGKIRGAYIALSNLAWVMALLIFGLFLGGFNFRYIYLISFAVMIIFFLVSAGSLRKVPDPDYDKKNTLKYIKEFFKNKNLFRAYRLTFLLQFFYCWMVIYTPIYLSAYLGFSWSQIGLIFAIMILPFLFVPVSMGRYADIVGERKILMLGFTIAALSTLSLFFVTQNTVFVWASLLFLTRIGASAVESMSDAYFFKHIRSENEEFIGVYRSASPVAYIIAPLVAIAIFYLVPSFKFIFLILGALMFFGVYLASMIEKSDV
jgi:MFS family permease